MNSIASCVSTGGFVRRSRSFAAFLLFAVITLAPFAAAQELRDRNASQASQSTTTSGLSPCASLTMTQLLTREGHSVRVRPNSDLGPQTPGYQENEKGVALRESPDMAHTLNEARQWFEKGARKGYAPAQVNLAVFSLVGWGASANAGEALYWFREAARQGYALAYFDLGILYLEGCGVRQDYTEAGAQFELGANAGFAVAQLNLAYLYDQGLGVAQNREKAAALYRQAADAGLAAAQYNLADLYLRGEGVPRDERAALALFQKAAQQGHTAARIMLGSMYAEGVGATKDLVTAYTWLSAASQQGDRRADTQLFALERQLSPAQIAEAKARARSLDQADQRTAEVALLH